MNQSNHLKAKPAPTISSEDRCIQITGGKIREAYHPAATVIVYTFYISSIAVSSESRFGLYTSLAWTQSERRKILMPQEHDLYRLVIIIPVAGIACF
jgi:hypothetical protein